MSLGQLYHGADSVGVGAEVVGDAVGGVGANVVGDAVGGVGAEVVGVEVGLRLLLLLLERACASENSFVKSAPSSSALSSPGDALSLMLLVSSSSQASLASILRAEAVITAQHIKRAASTGRRDMCVAWAQSQTRPTTQMSVKSTVKSTASIKPTFSLWAVCLFVMMICVTGTS